MLSPAVIPFEPEDRLKETGASISGNTTPVVEWRCFAQAETDS